MYRSHNANANIIGKIREIVPSMRYDDSEPFAVWQERAYDKLYSLLGLDKIDKVSDPAFEIEYRRESESYTEIRLSFQSEEGYFVPCHLLIPADCGGKLPLAICLQGHSTGMHISLGNPKFDGDEETISGGDRDFCVRAVREGFAALALEQRCFGECGGTPEPDCHNTAMDMLMVGRTLVGARVWDVMRAIDVLLDNFDFIDADRIVCMGNSGGGTTAFYAGCIDSRIALTMPSCAFCTYDDSIIAMSHCDCNYIPGARAFFDMGDLAGLIAPRKFIAVCGRGDPIFPLNGVKQAFSVAGTMFRAAGAEDNISLVIGEGSHRFYADLGWAAAKGKL